MRILRSEEEYDLGPSVLALGTFDGVHKGHQAMIQRAMALAREMKAVCVVYSFDRHPLSVLAPEKAPEPLLSPEEKLEKLRTMGVDGVLLQEFTREFAAIEPVTYLERLAKNMQAKGIVAGFNYSFGAGGRGNADLIRAQADRLGYRAEIVEAVMDGEDVVSSTLLRSLYRKGDVQRCRRLLKLGNER